ncbi:CoA transferase [Ramlibacter henchirensis]|uniref:CoA transferase n=1 Tax=Ramlibacter henchirensis TaxID=204072 RepID=A0A4Z0BVW6_9BURK|nr:CaiB/BaiF CoA-transferase family protein [Ramlibacter henchirensis]TFZ02852.1 CoA transferase [Ramlibacter henchirensis]
MAGPLRGLRVLEFAGLGPAPFACMLLSDMGADVVTVDRPEARFGDSRNVMQRGRTVVQLDLKSAEGRDRARELADHADVLVEGFRPGVMERLGLGPVEAQERNPGLVYARMTGWGQDGPLARTAGHDINYIALSGALHAIGPRERPVAPLNLLGDYGGGSLYLVTGILAALFERQRSGRGQVVDAAIVDGVTSLMTQFVGMGLRGNFVEQRENNMLDGAAPWYSVYETEDGQHVSVGAIEPQFFSELCQKIGLAPEWPAAQNDRARWPELRTEMAAIFRTRTRDQWAALLQDSDCCVAPVLSLSEAARHVHNAQRKTFTEVDGMAQPAPAPRFSRTPAQAKPVATAATRSSDVLARWTEGVQT